MAMTDYQKAKKGRNHDGDDAIHVDSVLVGELNVVEDSSMSKQQVGVSTDDGPNDMAIDPSMDIMASEVVASPKQSFIGDLDVELKVINRRRKETSKKRGNQIAEGGSSRSHFDVLSSLSEDVNTIDHPGDNVALVQQNVNTNGPSVLTQGKRIAQPIVERNRSETAVMGGNTDVESLSETPKLYAIGECWSERTQRCCIRESYLDSPCFEECSYIVVRIANQ
ncbi:hypothetical protein V6N12_003005 [Hibiscus sabdariffa]|uniref:Uncharacterized protein n=1 Tax=Hibiscus sabdariffa TaxID=183260 RepID=A0ABR2EAM1_9ROSI